MFLFAHCRRGNSSNSLCSQRWAPIESMQRIFNWTIDHCDAIIRALGSVCLLKVENLRNQHVRQITPLVYQYIVAGCSARSYYSTQFCARSSISRTEERCTGGGGGERKGFARRIKVQNRQSFLSECEWWQFEVWLEGSPFPVLKTFISS